MGKTHRRYRGVDLEARRKAFGEIYLWLYRRHDQLLYDLKAKTPALWAVTARSMEGDGIRSKDGQVPTRSAVRSAWQDVSRHHPEDVLRYAAAREADTGHVSRRHKGWVPTSTLPAQPPVAQVTAQPSQAPGSPPPRPAQTPSVSAPGPPVPASAIEPGEDAPLGHPDHPLGPLTALEIDGLANYLTASLEVQRRVLKTFRKFHHADRFSRPSWQ